MKRTRNRLTGLARVQRKSGNNAEGYLWLALRDRNLSGVKFRRQLPIGPYIADFACVELRLVVEVDGSQHAGSAKDIVRDEWLNQEGWSVARFWHGDVLNNYEAVLDTIAAIVDGGVTEPIDSFEFQFRPAVTMATDVTPHPNPRPSGGEREFDSVFMAQAIALGRPGRTWPNPAVGCVLVKDGVVIGEGFTGDGGRPHAEENALDAAGESAKGATAYVTLEPCGKRSTGCASCSERLVAAGVARVVYACEDPSPYASHVGPQRLIDAGVTVEAGLLEGEATHLIAPFGHFLKTGRPMVRESDDPTGFDAEFQPGKPAHIEAELIEWAARGYRHLRVPKGSELAAELRQLGYLAE